MLRWQELKQKSRVADLKKYLDHIDPEVILEAAYLISTLDTKAGIQALESALRINGGNKQYRKRAFAQLGNLYATINEPEKSKQAYVEAIKQ